MDRRVPPIYNKKLPDIENSNGVSEPTKLIAENNEIDYNTQMVSFANLI